MKNINKLNRKLEKLNSQKIILESINTTSLFKFIKYKYQNYKKEKLKKEIHTVKYKAKEIKLLYDYTINLLIKNPKINCRRYSRKKAKLEYKTNLKLYRLGFTDVKPLSPFGQKIHKFLEEKNLLPSQHIPKKPEINKKLLSKKINNMAIHTVKKCIKGYRKLHSNFTLIHNSILSNNSIQTLKNIIDEANMQLYIDETTNKTNNVKIPEKESLKKNLSFRESLKFNPAPVHQFSYTTSNNTHIYMSKRKPNISLHRLHESR